jgi:hypothetical protein
MKRIIDGITYNTDTSTPVARYRYKDHIACDRQATVYQTRSGSFFIVHRWDDDGEAQASVEAISRKTLMGLMKRRGGLGILNQDSLNRIYKAAGDHDRPATLYVRVPSALKTQVETLAKKEDMSLNAWIMRCMERGSSPID